MTWALSVSATNTVLVKQAQTSHGLLHLDMHCWMEGWGSKNEQRGLRDGGARVGATRSMQGKKGRWMEANEYQMPIWTHPSSSPLNHSLTHSLRSHCISINLQIATPSLSQNVGCYFFHPPKLQAPLRHKPQKRMPNTW